MKQVAFGRFHLTLAMLAMQRAVHKTEKEKWNAVHRAQDDMHKMEEKKWNLEIGAIQKERKASEHGHAAALACLGQPYIRTVLELYAEDLKWGPNRLAPTPTLLSALSVLTNSELQDWLRPEGRAFVHGVLLGDACKFEGLLTVEGHLQALLAAAFSLRPVHDPDMSPPGWAIPSAEYPNPLRATESRIEFLRYLAEPANDPKHFVYAKSIRPHPRPLAPANPAAPHPHPPSSTPFRSLYEPNFPIPPRYHSPPRLHPFTLCLTLAPTSTPQCLTRMIYS